MKINTEKIARTIYEEKTTYVAIDGTTFSSEEECKKYEGTAQCVINSRYHELITHKEYISDYGKNAYNPDNSIGICVQDLPLDLSLSCEDCLYAIKLNTQHDIDAANMYMASLNNSNCFTDKDLGTVQIIADYDGGAWIAGTPDQLREKFERTLDWIINGAPTCKGCKFWNGIACAFDGQRYYAHNNAKADNVKCATYVAKEE